MSLCTHAPISACCFQHSSQSISSVLTDAYQHYILYVFRMHSLHTQNIKLKLEYWAGRANCLLGLTGHMDHTQSIRDGGKRRDRVLWTAYPKRSNPQRPKRPSATTRTLDSKVAGTSPVWSNSRSQVRCIERISPSGSFCPSYEHGRSECKPSPTNTSQVTKPHRTCGEKRSCGCSGQENRTQSVLEWLVMLKVRERPSLM